MTLRFIDRVAVGSTKTTESGYLVATARVARTGVQLYRASELGDVAKEAGFADSDIVKVYRHEDQVFAPESLATITRLPVTVDHPKEDVTAANWSDLAVGEVGDAYSTEPEWVIVNPMIKDAQAVKAAATTHKEISMGYSAEIVKARDGLDADFEQRNIRYNHLALVPRGRAGDKARIGDEWGLNPINDFQSGAEPKIKGGRMAELKTVVLGDKAVQVADTDVAAVEQFKAQLMKQLADAEVAKKKADEDKDEEIGTLKAKLKKAEDAAVIDVDALVAARTELVAAVHAVDSSIEVKGKSDAELRKAAVAKRLGDSMVVDASDAEINGMFKAICKDAAPARNPLTDSFKTLQPIGDAAGAAQKAWRDSVNADNAWRNQTQGGH